MWFWKGSGTEMKWIIYLTAAMGSVTILLLSLEYQVSQYQCVVLCVHSEVCIHHDVMGRWDI